MRTSRRRARPKAFSLLELLIVCGIIAVVVGFTVPAVTTLLRGSQLTQGAQLLSDQISIARQRALTKCRPVEVRFYKFGDPETPGESNTQSATGKYRAMQLFEVMPSGPAVPVGKVHRLPPLVVINESAQLSSLVGSRTKMKAGTVRSTDPSIPELPRDVGLNYEFVSFRFEPDGSTNLPLSVTSFGRWFLTLHGADRDPVTTNKITDPEGKVFNFFTLQIDPVSGASKAYRPAAG